MKISIRHAKQIHHRVQKAGFTEEMYQLVKKRGWVHVILQPNNSFWSFFEEKSTVIDEQTHNWVEMRKFTIRTSDATKLEFPSWQEVLINLETWLKNNKNSLW